MKAMTEMENAVMAFTGCDRLAANLAVNAVLQINEETEREE